MLLSFWVSLWLPALFCGPSFLLCLVLLHTSCSSLASFDFLPGLDLFQQLFTSGLFIPAFLQWTFQCFVFYFCFAIFCSQPVFYFGFLLGPFGVSCLLKYWTKSNWDHTTVPVFTHVNVVTWAAFRLSGTWCDCYRLTVKLSTRPMASGNLNQTEIHPFHSAIPLYEKR